MPKRKSYNKCCEICPSKSRKQKIVFGEFKRDVLFWDCEKTHIVYFVFCRICRSQHQETVYIGQCKVKLKKRFSNSRAALNNFNHKDPTKRRADNDHTNLERHFAIDHNITDHIYFQKQIEIAIISSPIENDTERVNKETYTKDWFRECTKEMKNVRLLNN